MLFLVLWKTQKWLSNLNTHVRGDVQPLKCLEEPPEEWGEQLPSPPGDGQETLHIRRKLKAINTGSLDVRPLCIGDIDIT